MSQRLIVAQIPETSIDVPLPQREIFQSRKLLLHRDLHLGTSPSRHYSSAYQHTQHPEMLSPSEKKGPMTFKICLKVIFHQW